MKLSSLSVILVILFGFSNLSMAQILDLNNYINDPTNFRMETYIKLSEGLGYKLKVREGLIIYGLIDEDIPSDVYFIPIKRKNGQGLKDLITQAFSDTDMVMLDMIFGHLGRTPGLAVTLGNMEFKPVYFEKIKRTAKVAYCRFVFNYYFGDFKSDFPTNPEIRNLALIFDGKAYNIKTKDFSEEQNGTPALFEAICF